jgi:hypothetical protein
LRRFSFKQQVEVRPESLLVLSTRDEVLQFCDRFVEPAPLPPDFMGLGLKLM